MFRNRNRQYGSFLHLRSQDFAKGRADGAVHLLFVDLLEERRAELGVPSETDVIVPARDLLLQGGLAGLALLMLSLGAWLWLMRQADTLKRDVDRLQPVEVRVQAANQRLTSINSKTKALENDSSRIAQLVSIRSGSAFLQQLRQVTPDGVQLTNVSVLPDQISFTGLARSSQTIGSFARINALALNLEALPGVPDQGARVEEASTDDDGLTEFAMSVAVDPSVRASPAELRELGAEGLARRYERLRQQGFDG